MISRKKALKLLIPIVLSASALIIYSLRHPAALKKEALPLDEAVYHLERVIDGDTIVVSGLGHVRYIGVDTPEAGEPFYDEAKKRNTELVGGKGLRLEICGPSPRDRYGRTLALVYANGIFVNEELLKQGLARALIIPPCGVELADELRAVEKQALLSRAGMWAGAAKRLVEHDRLKTIDAKEAVAHIGERVKVRGVVVSVRKSRKAVFVNFGTGSEKDFMAVIFKDALSAFSVKGIDPMSYRGKVIEVTGVVKMYRQRPEIIVKTPLQIEDAGP
ncbi:MAG: thermonuclease family protein [Deltaproteobacteria bacterium]|nr:thermonuclease family protein [Deltaproteobacteria bacterium]